MCALFKCDECGARLRQRNPYPTVDIVIYHADRGIVLVKRRFEPLGWALPGGFVEYGEMAEQAAIREAREETGLDVRLKKLLGVYSDPGRDLRQHTISTVYYATAVNPDNIQGGDDAGEAHFFKFSELPALVFDHERIVEDFKKQLESCPSGFDFADSTC
jgi:8-oxo-dGTP diphosphatase